MAETKNDRFDPKNLRLILFSETKGKIMNIIRNLDVFVYNTRNHSWTSQVSTEKSGQEAITFLITSNRTVKQDQLRATLNTSESKQFQTEFKVSNEYVLELGYPIW